MSTCQFREKPGLEPVCKTLPEAGKDMCPRHAFMQQIRDQEKDMKAAAARAAGVVPNTRIGLQKKGYVFQGTGTCQSAICGRRIEWWRTPNSKNAPFDPMPEENSPAISHFATCEVYKRQREMKKAG